MGQPCVSIGHQVTCPSGQTAMFVVQAAAYSGRSWQLLADGFSCV